MTTPTAFTLAPDAVLTRNQETGAALVFLPRGRALRLSTTLGQLCEAVMSAPGLAASSDFAAWARTHHWDPEVARAGIQALKRAGVLRAMATDPADANPRSRSARRVEWRRPCTLRLTVIDPQNLCRVLAPVARTLKGRIGVAAAILGFVLQCVASGSGPQWTAVSTAPWGVIALVSATCVVHEFAHGIALAHAGGSPRRMGVMLFYLIPAFFCDVADSFTLSRRDQVHVALAGVIAQSHLGGLLVPLVLIPGAWEAPLACYFRVNTLMVLVNMVPFVALDGYFALRAVVGIPNLRLTALETWRGVLRRPIGGGTHITADRARRRLLVVLGAGASLFPPLMATFSATTLAASLSIDLPDRLTVMLAVVLAWCCTMCLRSARRGAAAPGRTPDRSPAGAISHSPSWRASGGRGMMGTSLGVRADIDHHPEGGSPRAYPLCRPQGSHRGRARRGHRFERPARFGSRSSPTDDAVPRP
ncbi:MAG: hypothetical protein LBK59_10730 [Bifidobacteriaceae bacterium]|nr:hypothetical protein [Bifidobacteriaceae bacterium]